MSDPTRTITTSPKPRHTGWKDTTGVARTGNIMSTVESAKNQDPSLYCAFFGGPRDGLKTGDMPATLSGEKLTGMVFKSPMSEPHIYSLHAVYVCTSETQIDGFWQFEFQGFEGPNGETLVAAEPEPAPAHEQHGLA